MLKHETVHMIVKLRNGDIKKMRFKVLDIKRMIIAVSAIVKTGHRVVFDEESEGGSYVQNKQTGRYYKIWERNGVYELPIWVRKPTTFGGQPNTEWA